MSTKIKNPAAVITTLRELDCCDRCILRIICSETSRVEIDSCLHPEQLLESLQGHDENVESTVKRIRKNVCPLCLGILDDSTIEMFVSNISLEEASYFESKDFFTLVSLPKCNMFREYSIYLHLKKNFPDVENPFNKTELTTKKIFRTASAEFIGKRLNKVYRTGSKLFLDFEVIYEDDEKEIADFRLKNNIPYLSRNNIEKHIKELSEDEFREVFPIPPTSPCKTVTCKVKFKSEPLFIGGRYLKFSREMGQTAFVVNNKHITETSVEDVVFSSIRKVLNINSTMVFSASGREDSDTRMLGNGRPFYIQIDTPRKYEILFNQCREIEEDIINSKLCAVIKLQTVVPGTLRKIKEGEELKRKHYKALCHTTHPDVNEAVELLNKYRDNFEVCQNTPIRVLHRRVVANRPKLIYFMRASLVTGHPQLFELDLITQAGTYVKEFVNSDFRRTIPSVTEILGSPTDVIALDVMGIELDWP